MRGASLRLANWHAHLNAVNAPAGARDWLASKGSLTAKLKAHGQQFRVQRLHQRLAVCLPDEAAIIGLGRPAQVWEREVLLKCDEHAVVFAHTVVPLGASAADWPLFSALGERSLGSTLFGDPQVWRGRLQFARLGSGHPLARRAAAALETSLGSATSTVAAPLYARRCLYRRHRGLLLVTEVFLPAAAGLRPRSAADLIEQPLIEQPFI